MNLKNIYIVVFVLTSMMAQGQELSKKVILNDVFMTAEYLGKSAPDNVDYRISAVIDMQGVDQVNHWVVDVKGRTDQVIASRRFQLITEGGNLKISTSEEGYFVDPKEVLLEGLYVLPGDQISGIYNVSIVAIDNSGWKSNVISQVFIIEDHD